MTAGLHLTFNGTCREAFSFYEKNARREVGYMLTYGASPAGADTPAHWRDKIVHGNLALGEMALQGADVLPEHYVPPQGFFILLDVDDEATAERYFAALAAGGSVKMPLAKTFWSPAFGVLVDRFGISWELNCTSR